MAWGPECTELGIPCETSLYERSGVTKKHPGFAILLKRFRSLPREMT